MISLPSLSHLYRASSTRIWLCTSPTDMQRGLGCLAEQAHGGGDRVAIRKGLLNSVTDVLFY